MAARRLGPPVLLGCLSAAIAIAFSTTPSIWGDEAATITSTGRAWGELVRMLGTIDAVHGLYYAVMKLWLGLVGYTPFTLRLPSAVAIGVATALLFVLTRRLADARVAFLAAVAFVLLPRVAWAGVDGRPYAMIALASVGLTLALHVAWVRLDRRFWVVYGALGALAMLLNVFLVLVVVSHGIALLWHASAQRHAGDAVRRWSATAGVAVLAMIPFVLEVQSQARQVSWVPALGPTTIRHVVVDAWFRSTWPFTTVGVVTLAIVPVAWALIVLGATRGRRAVPSRSGAVGVAQIAVPIAVFPTIALILATAVGVRLYAPTYAMMSTPFVAVLIALGVVALGARWLRIAAVAALVATAIPGLVAVKLPHTNQDLYWPQAAAVVEAARGADGPRATDGVVYGTLADAPWVDSRLIAIGYPDAFRGMRDLGVQHDARSSGDLWDRNGELSSVIPGRLGGIDRVWYIGDRDADPLRGDVARTLGERGFSERRVYTVGQVLVVRYERAELTAR